MLGPEHRRLHRHLVVVWEGLGALVMTHPQSVLIQAQMQKA